MGADTKISWCDATFNPWMGCTKIAPGCQACYAEAFAKRYGKAQWGPQGTRVKTSEANWRKPIKWNREAETAQRMNAQHFPGMEHSRPRVFCASLADVFEDWQGPILNHEGTQMFVNDQAMLYAVKTLRPSHWTPPATMDHLRRDLFAIIDATPHLDWLLLTKRPENVERMWPQWWKVPAGVAVEEKCKAVANYRPNVWLGTSISDQDTAKKAVRELLKLRELCPVLFVSHEPMLDWADPIPGIDWWIIGCESNGHRVGRLGKFYGEDDFHDTVRRVLHQCRVHGIAPFVKQLPIDGRVSHDPTEWPEDLRVQEFPTKATVTA